MDLIDFKAILIASLIFVPLERILSLYPEQKVLRKHWVNDLVYLFINGIPIKIGIALLVGALIFVE